MTDKHSVEQQLRAILMTWKDLQQHANDDFHATAEGDPAHAEALGRYGAYGAAAARFEKLLAEIPDLQTDQERYITARAEAEFLKGQLLELGKLAATATSPEASAENARKSFEILQPYIVLAIDNRPKQ